MGIEHVLDELFDTVREAVQINNLRPVVITQSNLLPEGLVACGVVDNQTTDVSLTDVLSHFIEVTANLADDLLNHRVGDGVGRNTFRQRLTSQLDVFLLVIHQDVFDLVDVQVSLLANTVGVPTEDVADLLHGSARLLVEHPCNL